MHKTATAIASLALLSACASGHTVEVTEMDLYHPTTAIAAEIGPETTVVLRDVYGGQPISYAMRLGEHIHAVGASVKVEGVCLSACTLVFAAAENRSMTPDAELGYHHWTGDQDEATDHQVEDHLRQWIDEVDGEQEHIDLSVTGPTSLSDFHYVGRVEALKKGWL